MYGLVVGGCNISPTYFLDEMCANEVDALITNYNSNYKNAWEQTRYIAYIIAATNSEKVRQPQDLIKFTWEVEEENANKPVLTTEQQLAMQRQMIDYIKNLKSE